MSQLVARTVGRKDDKLEVAVGEDLEIDPEDEAKYQ